MRKRPEYVPSPEEISARTEAIKAGWSEKTRKSRKVVLKKPGIKVVDTSNVREYAQDEIYGWDFTSYKELDSRPKITDIEEVPENELLERALFQAEPVQFGRSL